jgi:hypothetical protein
MGAKRPRPVVLDAGALIAVDRADRRVIKLLELAEDIHVPDGVTVTSDSDDLRRLDPRIDLVEC